MKVISLLTLLTDSLIDQSSNNFILEMPALRGVKMSSVLTP